ncbi:MAG: N-acetylneuraminate synthase [Candidatus Marinimicrobia bacterium]|nr:N-acetylneuraminate synthase [Candidatus Neomarinimicrobiota bacterium]|tara:strand:+ start:19866 stop:20741 length:876 start_codon:yes stop_codon:yes gene_type:complete
MVNLYIKPKIIAEIGCNHKGSMDIAFELLDLAKQCGADVAKFQKRNSKELLSDKQYNSPHPNPENSYGSTYGEHREFLEFNLDQNIQLMNYCNKIGIEYSTSVWDVTSAKEIVSINPKMIKVPSACNNHFEMLKVLRDEYHGDIHISLGMTTEDEVSQIINFFDKDDILKNRVIIYACTSGYPVPFDQLCLLEIKKLINNFGDKVKSVGFSGHHLGISVDIAAYTLGAKWIERHFTKERTWKGTDHAASLEPAGLSKLIRDLNATHNSLKYKEKDILEIEKPQREKLKWQK